MLNIVLIFALLGVQVVREATLRPSSIDTNVICVSVTLGSWHACVILLRLSRLCLGWLGSVTNES